jgi:hypothetical protein
MTGIARYRRVVTATGKSWIDVFHSLAWQSECEEFQKPVTLLN